MEGRDGKNYLNLILSDSSGQIEARKWRGANEVSSIIEKGNYVQVKGKVNNYQNRIQVIVDEIEKISENDIDLTDFIPKSENDSSIMFDELIAIVEQLDDVYIKELLQNILHDHEIFRKLKSWSAGKSIHHAYQSGLLEHILSCSNLALLLSNHYKVNKNYVVAGAILHDLCKVFELTEGPLVEYTDEGKLVGHLVKSAELIDHFILKTKGFPRDLKNHLKHILLSHHGHYEYGSPKLPQTSEAYLVHLIDLMDSKMNSLDTIKKTDKTPGEWSSYVKHLDRMVYKGKLPFYNKKINLESKEKNENHEKPIKTSEKLTHNMADQLKGFKVTSN